MYEKYFLVIFFGVLAVSEVRPSIVSDVKQYFGETATFISSEISNPRQTGAVLPCSPMVARKITKDACQSTIKGKKILEAGPGTGVLSAKLVDSLGPDDRLDLVEIDSSFCAVLREKFKKYENVHIHECSILDWSPDFKYDYIVSSLPFTLMDVSTVQSVLEKYESLISNDGIISDVKYHELFLFIAKMFKKIFSSKEEARRIQEVQKELDKFHDKFDLYYKQFVLLNVPPAYVHIYQKIKDRNV